VAPSEPEMLPLDPARDAEAAPVLAAAIIAGTADRAEAVLASAREDGATVFARLVDEAIVAVAIVRIDGLTAELSIIAGAWTGLR